MSFPLGKKTHHVLLASIIILEKRQGIFGMIMVEKLDLMFEQNT